MVKKIRVVLAGMASMMTELIEQILAPHPEFHIAGRVAAGHDLSAAARRYRADVLIVLQPGCNATDAEVGKMFHSRPSRVLAIAESGRDGMVYVLRPHSSTVSELSSDSLVAAIRAGGNTQ
jgi:hypothetical protein